MTFIAYAKCSTCQKAKKWLEEQGFSFTTRPIQSEPPTAEEIDGWQQKSGLPLKKFFNTSGALYRDGKVKDLLPTLSRPEQLELLASSGMMVKRPILLFGDTVLLGFKEKEWAEALASRQE